MVDARWSKLSETTPRCVAGASGQQLVWYMLCRASPMSSRAVMIEFETSLRETSKILGDWGGAGSRQAELG